jgi:hypothetical protein
MMRFAAACVGVALVLSGAPARADVRIQYDPGGHIGSYHDRLEEIRRSGERVVIDGPCMSACTLVLGMLPPDRLCATDNAAFGFHEAWYSDGRSHTPSAKATRYLLSHYPPRVRAWINQHGGLTPKMLVMRGDDLKAVVPSCSGGTSRTAGKLTARRPDRAQPAAYAASTVR